jgi:hypothetical protein
MPTTYIPRPDADFSAFAEHFYQAVEKWWQVQGLSETDLKPLKDALAAWDEAYPEHLAARNAAEAARQTKDSARLALEREVRPIANFIQTFPATTDADRATIGITVRQATGGTPRTPTSRPLVLVDAGDRLRHTIRFVDEASAQPGTGGRLRRARPKGTLGAEVRMVLTPPNDPAPIDPETMRYITLATNGEATTTFPTSAAGQTAVYCLRWVAPRGGVGPWSEFATATVAA